MAGDPGARVARRASPDAWALAKHALHAGDERSRLGGNRPLAEQLGQRADVRADHGPAGAQRLDCRQPQTLLSGGHDQQVDLAEELADVLFVLICLANQTGVDLETAFKQSLDKKTKRDRTRHRENQFDPMRPV